MKKVFSIALAALLSAGMIIAQDRATKIIPIKNGNLSQIFHTISTLVSGTGVVASTDNEHVILTGPKEAVTGFEEVVKQLDVMKKDVETTIYMIVATPQPSNAAPLPRELDPVVAQLRGVFSYKGFKLLDTFVLRSRDGQGADTSGFVPSAEATGQNSVYQFRYQRIGVQAADGGGHLIRFDGLKFSLRVPVPTNKEGSQYMYVDSGINTDVDVPEGKKVVVGKTSAVAGVDSALILVISAKVVD